MSKLSKALRDIYTSNDKYTVLQMLDKMITLLEEHEPGFYKHTIKVTYNTGSHNEWHTFIVYNNTSEYTNTNDLYCSDISGSLSTSSGGMVLYACNAGKISVSHLGSSVYSFTYNITNLDETIEEVA